MGATQAFKDGLMLGKNIIYVPGASPNVQLSAGKLPFEEFEATGVDAGTVVKETVDTAIIIAWGKELLQIS